MPIYVMISKTITIYSYETTTYMRMEAADKRVGSGVQCVLNAVFYYRKYMWQSVDKIG